MFAAAAFMEGFGEGVFRMVVRRAQGGAGAIPVFEIGDCSSVGKVANATESAYRAAMEID